MSSGRTPHPDPSPTEWWRAALEGPPPRSSSGLRSAYRHPPQLLPMWARPVVAVVSVLVLLGAYLTVVSLFRSSFCPHPGSDGSLSDLALRPGTVVSYFDDDLELRARPDGQCTGVTDRPGPFLVRQSSRPAADEIAIARLSELVVAENAEVDEARRQDGAEVRTVVVASMLSSTDDQSTRSRSAGVNELRGALLAQSTWNDTRTDPNPRAHPPFLVKLLLANFGGNSEYAEDTARQIKDVAGHDPSIIGVTGMGQSRFETFAAADILGSPGPNRPDGLMVLASVLSSNQFEGKPNFYRIAPGNDYESEQIVRFAQRRFQGREWTVVADASLDRSGDRDPYSDDLSDGLVPLLQNAPGLVRGGVVPYYSSSPTSLSDLAGIATAVCDHSRRSGRAPVVFFTGRANEVSSLLDGLNTTENAECGTSAVVIGGDDMTQLETSGFAELQQPFDYTEGQLYYPTFGPSDLAWQSIGYESSARILIERFSRAYQSLRAREPQAFGAPPNGHVDSAFDAVQTLSAVARDTPIPATTHDLGCTLRRGPGGVPYAGLTGRIQLPAACTGPGGADPADKLLVFQKVVGRPGNRSVDQLESVGVP